MRLMNEFWKPALDNTSECSDTVIPIPREALESYQMKFQLKLPQVKKTPKSKGVPPQLSVRERQALLQRFMVEGDHQQQQQYHQQRLDYQRQPPPSAGKAGPESQPQPGPGPGSDPEPEPEPESGLEPEAESEPTPGPEPEPEAAIGAAG